MTASSNTAVDAMLDMLLDSNHIVGCAHPSGVERRAILKLYHQRRREGLLAPENPEPREIVEIDTLAPLSQDPAQSGPAHVATQVQIPTGWILRPSSEDKPESKWILQISSSRLQSFLAPRFLAITWPSPENNLQDHEPEIASGKARDDGSDDETCENIILRANAETVKICEDRYKSLLANVGFENKLPVKISRSLYIHIYTPWGRRADE